MEITVRIMARITILGLLLLLLMCVPNFASAASGGRMGGTSFSSKKSSSSSSISSSRSSSSSISSSRSYSGVRRRHNFSTVDSYYSARRNHCSPASESDEDCDVDIGRDFIEVVLFILGCAILFGCVESIWFAAAYVTSAVKQRLWPPDKTTVLLKLQVGLLGPKRSLQEYLNDIAQTADTSTPEGLHYILTETVQALLRYHDYCISAYSSIDVKKNMKEGEKRFNQLSSEERVKFDEETFVNFNNMKKQSSRISKRQSGFTNEHIVVTILVAAGGKRTLPCINNSKDLKKALQKLASIPSTKTQAVEVLWTPQDDCDTLSEQKMLQDYPLLRSFSTT